MSKKLIISNIDFKLNCFGANDIISVMKEKLRGKNITASILLSDDNEIIIKSVDNRLFTSTVDNKIKLSPDSPRIKKLGRDYLISRRPTKLQMDYIWDEAINETLNNLKCSCTIELKKDDEVVATLRTKDGVVKEWIKETVYPVSK